MNFCPAVTLPRQRNSDQLILARAPAPDGHYCILWIFIIVYTAREAARYFNKDRKTIAKMLKHALPPGYRRTGLPNRPSPGPYIGVIDEILSTDKAEFPNLRSCQSLPKTSA